MWNHEKQARFDSLREQEQACTLTPSERDELQTLYQELYALEAASHAPAAQRAEQKSAALEERNHQLAAFFRKTRSLSSTRQESCRGSQSPLLIPRIRRGLRRQCASPRLDQPPSSTR